MIGGDNALAELFQIRIGQYTPKLRLTDEEYLARRYVAQLKIGEHPQLLQRSCREILRFINDQKCLLTLLAELFKKGLEAAQYGVLFLGNIGNTKGGAGHAQKFGPGQKRVGNVCRN